MGRIGRLLFRRLITDERFTVVAVNDIMSKENLLYLLKYDSLYGSYQQPLLIKNEKIECAGNQVVVLQQDNPENCNWKSFKVDVVLECSGRFTTLKQVSGHLKAGASKVLLSTTGSPDIPLLIYGFNHHLFSADMKVFSPGGCMTNCTTPVLSLLNDIGIESVQLNILHSYTSRQQLIDSSHKQFRRGRAAAESIIPVEIDLALSLERLLPMKGNIAALSVRVPVTNGAMADFTLQMKEPVTKASINQVLLQASQNKYKGVLNFTEDELVSADVRGSSYSCIIDGALTSVAGKQVKIIAWFDNEFGYTSRMIDWLVLLKNTSN